LREHADGWQTLRIADEEQREAIEEGLNQVAQDVLGALRANGASFIRDLARSSGLDEASLSSAIVTLAARGLVTSDSFDGARAIIRRMKEPMSFDRRHDLTGR